MINWRPMNPHQDVPRPNPDQVFRQMADGTSFGPQLTDLRTKLFDFANERIGASLDGLPDPVRRLVSQHIGHLLEIEEASSAFAKTALTFESSVEKKSKELDKIIQSAKRDVATKALREGTVGEFLQELGNVDQIADFACLFMQENFRIHSALASIFLDTNLVRAILTDEINIGENFDASADNLNRPFYSADFALKTAWTYKAKETSFDLNDFVQNALVPASNTFLARHRTPGIFGAIEVFERQRLDNEDQPFIESLIDASTLDPFRPGLATQVIGIFPLLYGDQHIGSMVNLIDRDAISPRTTRHPILELEGIAAATTRAIVHTGKISSNS